MATIAPPPKPINPVLLDSEHYIDGQIHRTRRALKLVDLATGLITLTIGLLAFVLIAAVLDQWVVPGGLSDGGRAALFGVLLFGVAWYGWRQFVPLLRPINPVYAAHTIERGTRTLKNSLLNLLLFRTHRQQMSARVYHALEQQAAQRLSTATVDASIDRSALLRLGYALLLIIAVAAIYSVLSPKNLGLSAVRVLAPWADVAAPSRVQILDVKPGATSIARGERLAVSAEVHGLKAGEPVRLRYSTVDEQRVDESLPMKPPSPQARRFEGQLPRGVDGAPESGVQQDLVYWIEAGDAHSKKFKATIFERPTLIVQKVSYEYPAYTGIPTKDVGNTGDIRGLEGTRVTIFALANQAIKSAHVDFDADGRNDVRMTILGDRATASFELGLREDRRNPRHGSYSLRLTTTEGRANIDPPKYRIEVTPDYAPEVRITAPEEPERTARVDEIVPIGVDARDPDFAVQNVRLVGKVGDREVQIAELLSKNHAGRFGAIKPFTPGDAQLKPGEVLEYWAEARDNRRPEANVAFSEHRRLKIAGPAQQPPPKGQQQPKQGGQQQDGQQQPGEKGQSGQGQGGVPQKGDQAGGEQGGEEKGQQGPGGKGGQGKQDEKAQSQNGPGGAGESGQSPSNEQQSNDGGDAAQPQAGQTQGQPKDKPGASPNEPQQGERQQQGQSQDGQSQDGQPQEGQPQDGQPPNGQPSKVSPKGDQDGDAMQRMLEHLDEQQAGDSANNSAGADQNAQLQDGGHKGASDAAGRTHGAEGKAGEGQPKAQQEGADPADAKREPSKQAGQPSTAESPPDKSTNSAGQSKNQSKQKPTADGAQSQEPRETATDAEQQTAPAGQNPSKQQGADAPRETKNGDGNPQDPKNAQQPSPDSAMNRNDGDAGSGGSTGEEQGSPVNEDQSHKRAANKTDEDNAKRREDQEPPMASPDKRESNSRGGKSGEQSGGGQEGGGQKADAAGKGEPGQHEAADDGAGRADEKGQGETGSKPGGDQLAEGKTGESSGDQDGAGSEQGETEGQPQGQPDGKQPNKQAQPNEGKPGGEQAGKPSPSGEEPRDASQDNQPRDQQPGAEGSAPESQPPDASQAPQGQPKEQQPSEQPGKKGSTGAAQPQGGGPGGATTAMDQAAAEQAKADEANLQFAKQKTDLVLERLDNQLAKKQVDRDLLKSLGWTEAELRQFVDRWKDLKSKAASEDDQGAAARELDAALRSLGLRQQGPTQFRAVAKADEDRDLSDAYRSRAPLEYADRVRAYLKRAAENNGK